MGTGVPVTFKITVSCMLGVEQHIVEQYVYPHAVYLDGYTTQVAYISFGCIRLVHEHRGSIYLHTYL